MSREDCCPWCGRAGDEATVSPPPGPVAKTRREIFAERVGEPTDGGCTPWLGSINRHGYGMFSSGIHGAPAHRFAYEFDVGRIPRGYDVHHLCGNRSCVNPDHLEAIARSAHLQIHKPWATRWKKTTDSTNKT